MLKVKKLDPNAILPQVAHPGETLDMSIFGKAPYGLCQCGCGGVTPIATRNRTKPKMVKGEPIRFLRTHHRMPNMALLNEQTGCWEWQGALSSGGYGGCYYLGRSDKAHRVYYKVLVGEIPAWADDLHHLCNVRKCVNPEHLVPITTKEHTQIGGRAVLTATAVEEIRDAYSGGEVYQKCLAAKYGVSQAQISMIVLNKSWVKEAA